MICRSCFREIDDLLDCPGCTQAKSYQAVLDLQKHFITRIQKGEYAFRLAKPAGETGWHLGLADYAQAWCGVTLNSRWKKKRLTWLQIEREPRTPVCDSCRRAFEGLATEVA
jgi:rubredoxin